MVYLQAHREVAGEPSAEFVNAVGRCGVDDASAIGANLEIANMDWVEFKLMEMKTWGGESPLKNKRYFDREPILYLEPRLRPGFVSKPSCSLTAKVPSPAQHP